MVQQAGTGERSRESYSERNLPWQREAECKRREGKRT